MSEPVRRPGQSLDRQPAAKSGDLESRLIRMMPVIRQLGRRDVLEVPTLARQCLAWIAGMFITEPLVPRATAMARVFERRLGPQPQFRLPDVPAAASRHFRHWGPRAKELRQIDRPVQLVPSFSCDPVP